jgi:hypothetical protein
MHDVTISTVAFLLLAIPAVAQQEVPVRAEVHLPTVNEPQEQFDIHIVFTNRSKYAFSVLNVRLELPKPLLVGARSKEKVDALSDPAKDKGDAASDSTREKEDAASKTTFDLYATSSHETVVIVPAINLLASPSLIFFRHGQYHGRVLYDYTYASAPTDATTEAKETQETSPPKRTAQPSSESFVLTLDGPGWAVVFGAAIGYPVFLFLRFVFQQIRGTTPAPTSVPLWIQWVGGLVVVVISAALFRFTSVAVPQLPIAVQVKDFWGGALLNLAVDPLTTWIGTLIAPTRTPRGDLPPESSSAPAPIVEAP